MDLVSLFLAWAVQATARLVSAMPRLFFTTYGTDVFLNDGKYPKMVEKGRI